MSRPGSKHKHAPKVISAIENTFDPLSNIETGIELGSECQEVIFENSFEKKRFIPYFYNNSLFLLIRYAFMQFSIKLPRPFKFLPAF